MIAITSSTEDAILLTGATGFVGMAVLARLLERTERQIIALVRGASQPEAETRMQAVMDSLFETPERHASRVTAVCGDLTEPALGLREQDRERLAEQVGEIIHGAASVAFDLSLPEARAINLEGTRQMLEFAELCAERGAGLRRLTYVSTAYVAGDRRGRVFESELDVGQGFRNAYERSKQEGESLVRSHRDRLSITVARPSIIVGERNTGWTASFNVIYGPLRAFAAGTYPLVPGRREAILDVVSVDHVADAILALTASPAAAGGTFHVVGGEHATTLGDLASVAARRFGRPAPRLVHPRVYRTALHPVMLRRGDAHARRRLKRSEIYFPYFSLDLQFDDQRARELLDPLGISATPLIQYFDQLVDFAEAASWGRSPIGRARAAERNRVARGRSSQPDSHSM